MLACALIGGCAARVDTIDVAYVPERVDFVVPGAASVALSVEPREGRTLYRERVSAKRDADGSLTGEIVARTDVPQTVADAVRRELTALGFRAGTGGPKVTVEVTRFYSDAPRGSARAQGQAQPLVADVALEIEVTAPAGGTIYARHAEGGAIEPMGRDGVAETARRALMAAFRNALRPVVRDPLLHQALITGRPWVETLSAELMR